MYRVLFFLVASALAASQSAASIVDSNSFINEFHYDNVGADRLEFVEVVVASSIVDLDTLSLTLYNGGTGRSYGRRTSLDGFHQGDTVDGFRFLWIDVSMQNGSPDGLALADGNQVLQFLSYEGTFLASNGVAKGLQSTALDVQETSGTPVGYSLQLTGSGDSYSDFSWLAPNRHTRGSLNHGQSFDGGRAAVPEPGSWWTWCFILGLVAIVKLASEARLSIGKRPALGIEGPADRRQETFGHEGTGERRNRVTKGALPASRPARRRQYSMATPSVFPPPTRCCHPTMPVPLRLVP